jgi:hypothetical protein
MNTKITTLVLGTAFLTANVSNLRYEKAIHRKEPQDLIQTQLPIIF